MRLRVLAAVLWTVIILVLCWTPQIYIPVSEGPGSLAQQLHLDKFVHAGIFAVFSVLWLRTRPSSKTMYLWVLLAGSALAAITEIVQNIPIINREGEFEDFLADFAGLLLGFPAFRWIGYKLKDWKPAAENKPEVSRALFRVTHEEKGRSNKMTTGNQHRWCCLLPLLAVLVGQSLQGAEDGPLSLSWTNEMLLIRGPHLYGGEIAIHYLEAFCRPGSTRRDWKDTVIPHRTRLAEASADRRFLRLRSDLDDGVIVVHEIRAGSDEVDFRVVATNPGTTESQAHWAQPCIRVDRFVGVKSEPNSEKYLPQSFVFLDGKLARMPTEPWAREARYIPGQVWCPEDVSRNDVNPRPLSSLVPSNGLIGCFSGDGKQLMATAWEPYQELFQGVIVCLHSDFRIGGLKPGQTKTVRGKIYLMPADVDSLLARYRVDFPEHHRQGRSSRNETRPHRLIEFGWDEPDLEFVVRNRELMKQSPFDGCVFHVNTSVPGVKPESLTWLGWGRREFKLEEFTSTLKQLPTDLRGTSDRERKAFDHNFLRFNVTPGKLDWFDDHRAVLANARLAGLLARRGQCDGILLDTEQYEGQLFDFSKQRDAARRGWSEYAAQARRRGREVMSAFQENQPDLTLMLTFGPSLLWSQSQGGKVPLEKCRYGLLVPFVDGLLDATRGKTKIVDGFEQSYGYQEPADFERRTT